MQEREFMRLGGMETIKVDVRIIAATNVDLKRMVDDGRFREDLYYRLNVISIELPPLRERKSDIPSLVQHFLQKYGEENAKADMELAPEALDLMMEYDWPGNVRELENVIERAVVLTTGPAYRHGPHPRPRAQGLRSSRFRKSTCRPEGSRSRKSSPTSRSASSSRRSRRPAACRSARPSSCTSSRRR
jgi:transcriptional regulator with GAF, ATPase, and Fis domain